MTMAGAIVGTLVLVGCGGTSQQQQAAQEGMKKAAEGAQQAANAAQQGSQQGANALAQGLQQMAQGFQQAAQTGPDGKPIQVVDFEKLVALLPPAGNGWERDTPDGSTTQTPFAMSIASAHYTKGNYHVKIEITDAAFNQMLIAPIGMLMSLGCNERSTHGYKRSSTSGATQTCEELNVDNKSVEVTAFVNKRFVVKLEANGMDSSDPVKEVSNGVDWNKLAGLK